MKFEKEEQVVGLILVEVGLMTARLMIGEEGLLDAGVGFLVVELALMAGLMAVDGGDSFIASSSTTDILSESGPSMSMLDNISLVFFLAVRNFVPFSTISP